MGNRSTGLLNVRQENHQKIRQSSYILSLYLNVVSKEQRIGISEYYGL